jgi:hypothetical protein
MTEHSPGEQVIMLMAIVYQLYYMWGREVYHKLSLLGHVHIIMEQGL